MVYGKLKGWRALNCLQDFRYFLPPSHQRPDMDLLNNNNYQKTTRDDIDISLFHHKYQPCTSITCKTRILEIVWLGWICWALFISISWSIPGPNSDRNWPRLYCHGGGVWRWGGVGMGWASEEDCLDHNNNNRVGASHLEVKCPAMFLTVGLSCNNGCYK